MPEKPKPEIIVNLIRFHRHEDNDSVEINFTVDGEERGCGTTDIGIEGANKLPPLPDSLNIKRIVLSCLRHHKEVDMRKHKALIDAVEGGEYS